MSQEKAQQNLTPRPQNRISEVVIADDSVDLPLPFFSSLKAEETLQEDPVQKLEMSHLKVVIFINLQGENPDSPLPLLNKRGESSPASLIGWIAQCCLLAKFHPVSKNHEKSERPKVIFQDAQGMLTFVVSVFKYTRSSKWRYREKSIV